MKTTTSMQTTTSQKTVAGRLRTACALRLLPLLLLVLPAAVQAQFTYTTNNSKITITGYTGSGGAVAIPSTINGLSVTSIGDYAFYGKSSLSSVMIPGSVINIGEGAFANCSGLTSVAIPDGVTSIRGYTFYCCSKLASVTIPGSVTSIGDYAFYSCVNLFDITIPDTVTSVGSGAFAGGTKERNLETKGVWPAAGCGSVAGIDLDQPGRPYAYVAMEGAGLLIIDISDPYAPRLISQCKTSCARDVKVHQGTNGQVYAFVADGSNGLLVFNVTDVHAPRQTAQFDPFADTPIWEKEDAWGVAVVARQDDSSPVRIKDIAVVAWGADGLVVVDVNALHEGLNTDTNLCYIARDSATESDPFISVFLGADETLHASGRCIGVGGFPLIASFQSCPGMPIDRRTIIDETNVFWGSSIMQTRNHWSETIGYLQRDSIVIGDGGFYDCRGFDMGATFVFGPYNGYALAAHQDHGLEILRRSTSTKWVQIAHYSTSVGPAGVLEPVSAQGVVAYLDKASGLHMIETTNAAGPSEIGGCYSVSFSGPPELFATTIKKYIVAPGNRIGEFDDLLFMDITAPRRPVIAGAVHLDDVFSVRDVAVFEKMDRWYAAVMSFDSGVYFYDVDLDDLNNLSRISSFLYTNCSLSAVEIFGDLAFVSGMRYDAALEDQNFIDVISITNIYWPRCIGTLHPTGSPMSIRVHFPFLVAPNYGKVDVFSVPTTDPFYHTQPLGSYDAGTMGMSVESADISDNLLFVGTMGTGVQVVKGFKWPRMLVSANGSMDPIQIRNDSDMLYVADGFRGLMLMELGYNYWPAIPTVQVGDPMFGVRTNRFGFNITGTTNLVIVVEACTNLANPVWTPVRTNTLIGGSAYFSDSQWTNSPGRFYRLRSP